MGGAFAGCCQATHPICLQHAKSWLRLWTWKASRGGSLASKFNNKDPYSHRTRLAQISWQTGNQESNDWNVRPDADWTTEDGCLKRFARYSTLTSAIKRTGLWDMTAINAEPWASEGFFQGEANSGCFQGSGQKEFSRGVERSFSRGEIFSGGVAKRSLAVVKFYFTNTKSREKHFSTLQLTGKHQISKSRRLCPLNTPMYIAVQDPGRKPQAKIFSNSVWWLGKPQS